MTKLVTARELAERFGIDKSNVLKWMKKHGAVIVTSRDPKRGNQRESAVTQAEARRLIATREAEGFEVGHV